MQCFNKSKTYDWFETNLWKIVVLLMQVKPIHSWVCCSVFLCLSQKFTKFFKFSRHVGILFLWSAHHHLGWSLHYSDGTGLNRWRSGNVLLHFNQNSNLKLYSKNLATCLPEQGETSDGTLDTDSSNILTGNRILSDLCFGLWKKNLKFVFGFGLLKNNLFSLSIM